MKRLVVIDGKSVFYRGYYAMPYLTTKDGTPTGGVFGFASLAIEIVKKLKPDYVCVAWDKRGTSIRRRLQLLPTYKAGRKTPPQDFFDQIPTLMELLDAFGWPLLEADDYEADDIMGTLAKQAEKAGIETCLVTSDLDMLQLVSPLTSVYAMKKGLANIEKYDPHVLEKKLGLRVEQFVDLKALKGDASDNISGVAGIGEKTAVKLLQEYGTLDEIYNHLEEIKPAWSQKLAAGREAAFTSREVAQIWCDAPVEFDAETMDIHQLDVVKLVDILRRLEFHSLIRRLPDEMKSGHESSGLYVEHEIDTLTPLPLQKMTQLGKIVALWVHEDEVWISPNRKNVFTAALSEVPESVWQDLGGVTVIGYDIKTALHQLAEKNVATAISVVHDINQAAFLLDPLLRDRSLGALYGRGEIDETSAGQVLAAVWAVYDAQQEAFRHQPGIARIAHDFDFPLVRLLFDIERRGVKIDTKRLGIMSKELEAQYKTIEQNIYDMVGYEFNIGSPAQLSDVLFTKLQLPTKGIKRGKTGYSTGQKELDKLRGLHPIIELIEHSREIAKLKNTYIDTLPTMVDEAGRLHTTFRQDVAATGRLSSSHPNLQNIPTRSEMGKKIRQAFIAEQGKVLVSADYSQFELRLAAVLADDKKLIQDFNDDIDVHTKTASDVYGVPLEEVTPLQRRHAKVINFGVLYGMSPHGLSAATGMTFADAKQFIDDYFTLRAPIRTFIDQTLEMADTQGFVQTKYGRRRPTPDVHSGNFIVRESAKRAAANMPIQGTEADLMKKAMLAVERRLEGLGEQILQIHDSILVECPCENAARVAAILRTEMEAVAPDLPITLKVDVKIGETWADV